MKKILSAVVCLALALTIAAAPASAQTNNSAKQNKHAQDRLSQVNFPDDIITGAFGTNVNSVLRGRSTGTMFQGTFHGVVSSIDSNGVIMVTLRRFGTVKLTPSDNLVITDRDGNALNWGDLMVDHAIKVKGVIDLSTSTLVAQEIMDFYYPFVPVVPSP